MALTDNLAAYWRLDESSGTRNDSHGTNHLTDVNTVGSTTGQIGSAGQFVAASSEYLTVADNAALSLGASSLTIAAWVYLDSKPAAATTIVGKYDGTNNEYILQWNGSAGDRFLFYCFTSGGQIARAADSFGAPALSTWYCVVGRFDATTKIVSISINAGAVDSSAAGTGSGNDTAVAFQIGVRPSGTGYWNGRIDEVGVWKRVLTTTEITQLYAGGVGLAYPFGEVAPRLGPRIVAVSRAATR